MEVKEISPRKFTPYTDTQKLEAKEKIRKMQKEGDKLVKGMFEFLDAQGGWLDFTYRFFPGEPCRIVRITHGEIVDLPMILVKHLNNTFKKVRTMPKMISEDGRILERGSIEKTSRTRFTPVDMM